MYTLEPLFLLASLTMDDQGADKPEEWVRQWLSQLVDYAHTIPLGAIEVLRESRERTAVKLRCFRKILTRWIGGTYEEELDGSLWEKGWSEMSQLLWTFL